MIPSDNEMRAAPASRAYIDLANRLIGAHDAGTLGMSSIDLAMVMYALGGFTAHLLEREARPQ